MPEDMSVDGAASTSDTCFELRLGKWVHFRVGDVSERVQLEVVRGLALTALAALTGGISRSTIAPATASSRGCTGGWSGGSPRHAASIRAAA